MAIPTPDGNGGQAAPVPAEKKKKPETASSSPFTFGKIGGTKTGHITILYGEPGTGKTTLAGMLPGKTAFIDLEDSLSKLTESWAELGIGENVQGLPHAMFSV